MKTIELTEEEEKMLWCILLNRIGEYKQQSKRAKAESIRQLARKGYNLCKSILEKL